MAEFKVNEIFHSYQGEGFNTGRPAIFIRLSGCNLNCRWCDTEFQTHDIMSLEDILDTISYFPVHNVVITGGEPTMDENFTALVKALKQNGYWIALETNGTISIDQEVLGLIDYIAVSPKSFYKGLYENAALDKADEVRIVADGDVLEFCEFIEDKIKAVNYFVSPCANIDDNFDMLEAIELLGKLNMRETGKKWYLSMQTHKIANIK